MEETLLSPPPYFPDTPDYLLTTDEQQLMQSMELLTAEVVWTHHIAVAMLVDAPSLSPQQAYASEICNSDNMDQDSVGSDNVGNDNFISYTAFLPTAEALPIAIPCTDHYSTEATCATATATQDL